MKKFYTFLFLFLISSFFHQSAAQLVSFSFAGSEGDEGSWPSSAQANSVASTTITRGPGVSAVANADRFNSKNWTTASSPDMNDYLEFIITPKAGYAVTISTLALQHQRSVTGPRSFVIRTSHDDFAANATGEITIPDVNANQSSSFLFNTPITTTAPLIIRIYAYNAEAANGTWGPGESVDGNDMAIDGTFRILPVRFVNVKAVWKTQAVEISWTNATESDIAFYVVERSATGRAFTELEKILPTKNNGGPAGYQIADRQPLYKSNYYRIKAVESNGHVLYSTIVKVDAASSSAGMGLYPNPVRAGAQIMLQLNGVGNGNFDVRIFNAAGQLVHRETLRMNGIAATQSISLSRYQQGIYVAEITGSSTRLQQQFIVQ